MNDSTLRGLGGFGAVALVALSSLVGCSSSDDEAASGNLKLADSQNYSSTVVLNLPTIETAATDVDICFTDVTEDLQCHAVAPQTDILNVSLVRFQNLPQSEILAQLASGKLSTNDVDGYFAVEPDHSGTCVKLSAMDSFGPLIDLASEFVADDQFSYVILASTKTAPGVGTKSMTFVHPTATSTETTVNLPNGCGILDYSADLSNVAHLPVSSGGPWVLDFKDIDHDSQGVEIGVADVDSVLIGFYAGLTVTDIQNQMLDLEQIATQLWEVPVSPGEFTADLAKATERGGTAPFAGFDRAEEGTWLVGLMCSVCQSPAPIALAILEP
jgi:hypothetical protein